MNPSYPFEVRFINGAAFGSPEQMYNITADFDTPELSAYKSLFDKYGAGNGSLSLVEVTTLIIEGNLPCNPPSNLPDLLDHMDFDEEGYLLDMYADSEQAVQDFTSTVSVAFQDLEQLERYIRKVADQ